MPALYFEDFKVCADERDTRFFIELGATREIMDVDSFKSAQDMRYFYWPGIRVLGDVAGEAVFIRHGASLEPVQVLTDQPGKLKQWQKRRAQ